MELVAKLLCNFPYSAVAEIPLIKFLDPDGDPDQNQILYC